MKRNVWICLLTALMIIPTLRAETKKIGIIGLDTSHSLAFTEIVNDTTGKYPEMEGFEVVAAYPRGSYTIPSSYERIPDYIEKIKGFGVEICESIDDLLEQVDFVLLETNDGNMHLDQAAQVFKAGKPVFIDKPVAGSLSDAIAIYELAERYGVPCFSSSSLRYGVETRKAASGAYGKVIGVDSYGPEDFEPSHLDFCWYGIHAIEALFAVMGPGCQEVSRISTPGTELAVGKWSDERIGTYRGNLEAKYEFGGNVFTKEGVYPLGKEIPYAELLKEIIQFFRTGIVPVSPQETLEIFTFMETARQSKLQGGCPVSTQKVFEENRAIALKTLQEKNY